tara:strand:- start:162 stop:605 length:444 start_codon:yes stop_codon:yes gene_type:complete
MSTIIGTTLNADTIRKTGGSLGTDIRIKNTSVYESDGGTSVTQNLVQGLCKAWIRFNGESTIAINDSFNMTSITDNDAGYYTTTYTNNFNTQYNSITICSDRDSNNHRLTHHFLESATTHNLIYMVNKDNSNADADKIAESVHGDLA